MLPVMPQRPALICHPGTRQACESFLRLLRTIPSFGGGLEAAAYGRADSILSRPSAIVLGWLCDCHPVALPAPRARPGRCKVGVFGPRLLPLSRGTAPYLPRSRRNSSSRSRA